MPAEAGKKCTKVDAPKRNTRVIMRDAMGSRSGKLVVTRDNNEKDLAGAVGYGCSPQPDDGQHRTLTVFK